MSRMEERARNAPLAVGQETIVMSRADRYLDTLEEMVAVGKARNDPTLAIAVSVDMLDLLCRDARKGRLPCIHEAMDRYADRASEFAFESEPDNEPDR